MKGNKSSLRILILLTLLFIFIQCLLFGIHFYISGLYVVARATAGKAFISRPMLLPELQFAAAQVFIYSFFIYAIWYVSFSLSELFQLSSKHRYSLSIVVWLIAVFLLLTANMVLVPHSFFTGAIQGNLLENLLTQSQLKSTFVGLLALTSAIVITALCGMVLGFYRHQHRFRHGVMFAFILFFALIESATFWNKNLTFSGATAEKPNVIIIGFDALRPDHLSYFNSATTRTPNFDALLKSSIVFNEALTPAARTMPSWVSVLSSLYPKSNNVRENNTLLPTNELPTLLPKVLREAGYATVYAADDRRFNIIDKRYGFDQVVGPTGTMPDFAIGGINDFPLSNLISTTRLGKYLFPYNYANHGASYSYNPDNFLTEIQQALIKRDPSKPLFLATHFGISAWPFYWFNDKLPFNASTIASYRNAVLGDDVMLAKFLALLQHDKLLDHAIVVVLSDHGITLGLPNDRVIDEKFYQGNKDDMKVRRFKLNTDFITKADTSDINNQIKNEMNEISRDGSLSIASHQLKNYTVNTSYSYGGDVLSLKQFHVLLAFKSYGLQIGTPHLVQGRAVLVDVMPTLLDLLHLKTQMRTEGISLTPTFWDARQTLSSNRPIYLESNFTLAQIEQRNIVEADVLKAGVTGFSLNLYNGIVSLSPHYPDILIKNKQRAILWGDWLLAYYPISERYNVRGVPENSGSIEWMKHDIQPYSVIVNLKSHAWTDNDKEVLHHDQTYSLLSKKISEFFGKEMANYH